MRDLFVLNSWLTKHSAYLSLTCFIEPNSNHYKKSTGNKENVLKL